jgi:filamentous hemagglutinin family protein
MKKIVLSSSLAFSLMICGCGKNRGELVPQVTPLAVKSATLASNTNTITTTDDFAKVTLNGEFGSKVFINDKEVGTFPKSGSLDVTLDVSEVGNYTYNMYSLNKGGKSKTIQIEVTKEQKSATLGTVKTEGKANALTASTSGVIFIAEKNHGVEVIKIGYTDKVVSLLLSKIDNINAQNVILSDDENKLFVEDENHKYHVMDISDINNPVELKVIEKIEKNLSAITEDGSTKYSIKSCGLCSTDISNPSNHQRNFLIKDKKIQDVILVENDNQLLIAHGEEGLQLFDVTDKKTPKLIGEKNLHGDTSGLSLMKKDGVLFVANGESGVEIFDLSILLFEMVEGL